MWRITTIALLLCAGCAESRHDCLLQDSFLGDLVRCLPFNHKDKDAVPVGGDEVVVSNSGSQIPVSATSNPETLPQPKQP